MELKLIRYSSGADDTMGVLLNMDDCTCMAYTIEDEHREVKVMHETRIPAGRYEIALRNEGGFSDRYLQKFGADFHRGMLCVFNKPNWKIENDGKSFQYILIHCGNDDDDTSGCILVGESSTLNRYRANGSIGNSTATYKNVYPIIRDKLLAGEKVFITIEDLA